jgi:hypothetical protein
MTSLRHNTQSNSQTAKVNEKDLVNPLDHPVAYFVQMDAKILTVDDIHIMPSSSNATGGFVASLA